MTEIDENIRDAFRRMAALHLRAALDALEHGDDSEAGMQLGAAGVSLAEAAVLPELGEPVSLVYSRRMTRRGGVQSLTITRNPRAKRKPRPRAARTADMGNLH